MVQAKDMIGEVKDDLAKDLEPIGNTPIAPAHGIATIALSMAMKYHDFATVQDGQLYQQYKLEGKNMTPLHLDMVLETAAQLELWLLGSSQRIAKIVVDCIQMEVGEDKDEMVSSDRDINASVDGDSVRDGSQDPQA